MTHTPLPWKRGRYGGITGRDNNPVVITDFSLSTGHQRPEVKPNTDFIFKACNSYYETQAALEAKDAEIARANNIITDMYNALAECSDYFDNRFDAEMNDMEWEGNAEAKLYTLCEDALVPADEYVKRLKS